MTDAKINETDENELSECGEPCDPALGASCCKQYWLRMVAEGYWIHGKGWTAKGMREICK